MLVSALTYLLLGASLVRASSPLCIQGCCNHSLELKSDTLSLSSNTDTISIKLPGQEIPCCECPAASSLKNEGVVMNEGQQPSPEPRCHPGRVPFDSGLPDWCCEYGGCGDGDCPGFRSFATVRRLVGCDVLPLHTPLCPAGRCRKGCLCGEILLRELKQVLIPKERDDFGSQPEEPNSNYDKQEPIHVQTEL